MTKNEKLLLHYRKEHDIAPKYLPCTLEEHMEYAALHEKGKELPEGIRCRRKDDGALVFEKADWFDISQEEINEILQHKQLDLLSSINSGVSFLVGVVVVGLIVGLIGLIYSCSAML